VNKTESTVTVRSTIRRLEKAMYSKKDEQERMHKQTGVSRPSLEDLLRLLSHARIGLTKQKTV